MESPNPEKGKRSSFSKRKLGNIGEERLAVLAGLTSLPPETLLFIWQAAMLRQVSEPTLKGMLDDGELEFRWIGRDRRVPKWLIIESDKKYIEERNRRIEEYQKR